jgi:hypothetical protein
MMCPFLFKICFMKEFLLEKIVLGLMALIFVVALVGSVVDGMFKEGDKPTQRIDW